MFDKVAIRVRGPKARINFPYEDYLGPDGQLQSDPRVEQLATEARKAMLEKQRWMEAQHGDAKDGGPSGAAATAAAAATDSNKRRRLGGHFHDVLSYSLDGTSFGPAATLGPVSGAGGGGGSCGETYPLGLQVDPQSVGLGVASWRSSLRGAPVAAAAPGGGQDRVGEVLDLEVREGRPAGHDIVSEPAVHFFSGGILSQHTAMAAATTSMGGSGGSGLMVGVEGAVGGLPEALGAAGAGLGGFCASAGPGSTGSSGGRVESLLLARAHEAQVQVQQQQRPALQLGLPLSMSGPAGTAPAAAETLGSAVRLSGLMSRLLQRPAAAHETGLQVGCSVPVPASPHGQQQHHHHHQQPSEAAADARLQLLLLQTALTTRGSAGGADLGPAGVAPGRGTTMSALAQLAASVNAMAGGSLAQLAAPRVQPRWSSGGGTVAAAAGGTCLGRENTTTDAHTALASAPQLRLRQGLEQPTPQFGAGGVGSNKGLAAWPSAGSVSPGPFAAGDSLSQPLPHALLTRFLSTVWEHLPPGSAVELVIPSSDPALLGYTYARAPAGPGCGSGAGASGRGPVSPRSCPPVAAASAGSPGGVAATRQRPDQEPDPRGSAAAGAAGPGSTSCLGDTSTRTGHPQGPPGPAGAGASRGAGSGVYYRGKFRDLGTYTSVADATQACRSCMGMLLDLTATLQAESVQSAAAAAGLGTAGPGMVAAPPPLGPQVPVRVGTAEVEAMRPSGAAPPSRPAPSLLALGGASQEHHSLAPMERYQQLPTSPAPAGVPHPLGHLRPCWEAHSSWQHPRNTSAGPLPVQQAAAASPQFGRGTPQLVPQAPQHPGPQRQAAVRRQLSGASAAGRVSAESDGEIAEQARRDPAGDRTLDQGQATEDRQQHRGPVQHGRCRTGSDAGSGGGGGDGGSRDDAGPQRDEGQRARLMAQLLTLLHQQQQGKGQPPQPEQQFQQHQQQQLGGHASQLDNWVGSVALPAPAPLVVCKAKGEGCSLAPSTEVTAEPERVVAQMPRRGDPGGACSGAEQLPAPMEAPCGFSRGGSPLAVSSTSLRPAQVHEAATPAARSDQVERLQQVAQLLTSLQQQQQQQQQQDLVYHQQERQHNGKRGLEPCPQLPLSLMLGEPGRGGRFATLPDSPTDPLGRFESSTEPAGRSNPWTAPADRLAPSCAASDPTAPLLLDPPPLRLETYQHDEGTAANAGWDSATQPLEQLAGWLGQRLTPSAAELLKHLMLLQQQPQPQPQPQRASYSTVLSPELGGLKQLQHQHQQVAARKLVGMAGLLQRTHSGGSEGAADTSGSSQEDAATVVGDDPLAV